VDRNHVGFGIVADGEGRDAFKAERTFLLNDNLQLGDEHTVALLLHDKKQHFEIEPNL
jgi:hypothetical protein